MAAMVTEPTVRVNDLLIKMQKRHQHMAAVVEDGRFLGVVTMENLIEEVLGEIWDEQDLTPDVIVKLDRRTFLVHGDTKAGALEDCAKAGLREEDEQKPVHQILAQRMRSPLKEGTEAIVEGLKFKVVEVEDGRAKRVVARCELDEED